MTAEREFAGFVLPFAAGIFLATGPALIRFPLIGTASLMMTALLLIIMMHPLRLQFRSWIPWLLVGLLGLSAGAFMGASSLLMSLSSIESSFEVWACGLGHRMGEFIDGVPFGNSDTNALLKALITGERNDIPRPVSDAFRDSGAAHILSLSGFHLGIVYALVKGLLSWLGNNPAVSRLRSVLIVLLCGFYTLATGAGPSIVRAFLFILLGETARLLHRQRTTATLLLSALMLQLAFSPVSIRSVSFQLSYAAMAGIAWIYPWLRDLWPDDSPQSPLPASKHSGGFLSSIPKLAASTSRRFISGFPRHIWNSAALSISCQLTTAPLAYLYFGTFPQNFLLTNLLALPLTTLLIPLGLIVFVLTGLGICPAFLLQATDALVSAQTFSLEVIAGM